MTWFCQPIHAGIDFVTCIFLYHLILYAFVCHLFIMSDLSTVFKFNETYLLN